MHTVAKHQNKLSKHIKEELKIFNNFSAILEKADVDGYIQRITESVSWVFSSEIGFAVKGGIKRAEETQGEEKKPGR